MGRRGRILRFGWASQSKALLRVSHYGCGSADIPDGARNTPGRFASKRRQSRECQQSTKGMKRNFALCLIGAVLLSTGPNAPAPIVEESRTPAPEQSAKPKPKREETPRSTTKLAARQRIVIHASEFVRPQNVVLGGVDEWGSDALHNGPPFTLRPNAAEFDFSAAHGGQYLLKIEYAAQDARPCRVILNGRTAIENAMNASTGCWQPKCQQLLNQGIVMLKDGSNVMRIERDSVFPHIRKIIFEPIQ